MHLLDVEDVQIRRHQPKIRFKNEIRRTIVPFRTRVDLHFIVPAVRMVKVHRVIDLYDIK